MKDKQPSRITFFQNSFDIPGSVNGEDGIEDADIIMLCTKPQEAKEAIGPIIKKGLTKQLIISIVAGYSIGKLEQILGKPFPVIRAMPNTPCEIGEGMTVLAAGKMASEQHLEWAEYLFQAAGRTMVLEEKHLDTVTALSASGPAFVYLLLEAMAEGGVREGLSKEVSTLLSAQAALGAARMVIEKNETPETLKKHVTTPGGCTIEGLATLEKGDVKNIITEAVASTVKRSRSLGEE